SWRASQARSWKKLMKPGPAMLTWATASLGGRAAMIFSARSLGFMPAGLARAMARVLAKSPWLLSRAVSTWMLGLISVGSTPSVCRVLMALASNWLRRFFMGAMDSGYGLWKTRHYPT